MRQALTLALLHLRLTFKSKGSLITMFAMPLLLTLIFGMLMQGTEGGSGSKGYIYPVAVIDHDDSFASRQLLENLKARPNLALQDVTTAEMQKLFGDKEIVAGLVIPAGFETGTAAGTAPEVELVVAPGGNLHLGVGPIVRGEVAQFAQDYRLALAVSPAAAPEAYKAIAASRAEIAVTVAAESLTREVKTNGISARQEGMSHVTVGFTVTFVMMVVFMMSGVILQERKRGTWGRLLITPTGRATLLAGYLLSFFLTGMAQFTILVGATRLMFGVNWGPLLPLGAMAAATVLCASGMGLFIAGLVKTYEQQVTFGVLLVNATSMLGGVYWDLSFVSETMRRVGYLTPQAWAIDGFKEVILRGGSFEALVLPLAVLLGIAAVFMTAGLVRVRYE